jgi:hypothetical protein
MANPTTQKVYPNSNGNPALLRIRETAINLKQAKEIHGQLKERL